MFWSPWWAAWWGQSITSLCGLLLCSPGQNVCILEQEIGDMSNSFFTGCLTLILPMEQVLCWGKGDDTTWLYHHPTLIFHSPKMDKICVFLPATESTQNSSPKPQNQGCGVYRSYHSIAKPVEATFMLNRRILLFIGSPLRFTLQMGVWGGGIVTACSYSIQALYIKEKWNPSMLMGDWIQWEHLFYTRELRRQELLSLLEQLFHKKELQGRRHSLDWMSWPHVFLPSFFRLCSTNASQFHVSSLNSLQRP